MIGLWDRLAHLNYRQGGQLKINPSSQVDYGVNTLTLNLNGLKAYISLDERKPGHLAFACSQCQGVCEHVGGVFSLVLEEKLFLGLAAAPRKPTVWHCVANSAENRIAGVRIFASIPWAPANTSWRY